MQTNLTLYVDTQIHHAFCVHFIEIVYKYETGPAGVKYTVTGKIKKGPSPQVRQPALCANKITRAYCFSLKTVSIAMAAARSSALFDVPSLISTI